MDVWQRGAAPAQGPRALALEDWQKYGLLAAGGLLVFLMLFALLRGRRRADPDRGLAENLAGYPTAPGRPRHRLTVRGQPARLRLVAVAPMGQNPLGDVEALLAEVARGLGEAARQDRPRVRVWPPQLSATGFPQQFFRLTLRPEAPGRPSHWVRVAGQARVGSQPILLGLALYADDPTQLDQVILQPNDWAEALRVTS
jgi:hypothetical protein